MIAVITVAGFYVVYALLLTSCQRKVIFPAHIVGEGPEVARFFPGAELLPAEVATGALVLPEGIQKPPVFIIAHGNAELITDWADVASMLADNGCGALVVEFPGYGRAGGKPGQAEIGEVFERSYDWLGMQHGISPEQIFGLGRSIGTGVICDLSTRRELAGMVLISPPVSIRKMAQRRFLPGSLVRHPFDNDDAVRDFTGPVLLFHGKGDTLIPYADSETLKSLAQDGELVPLPGGHNDVDLWGLVPRIAAFGKGE